ncbi:MAG: SDR family NAD(P)-dependent oxidoreductase [Verrucomicrobia bacterium]|nr:SDR family NAD(P)-dependent oxidoreductase [Verrucomicrobiota bacterium]
MSQAIAIVGMACLYPEARTPTELWENALAQRRAFRRLPRERLELADYHAADPQQPDRTYSTEAALIEGYEFDRVAFRVVGSTYRSADLAHWVALDVATRALADAGFGDGAGLPARTTGVLVGNTLTGEFSRANTLRLRWPYVRRVVAHALAQHGWGSAQRTEFLSDLETQFKAPFPPVGEETLAGGLSNTIAGRICNHFNLKGGGYTVDGACASSLLAVAQACSALTAEDLDVALAGGVDLSLDPFELVGFAKTGALARDEMRVYDLRSAGFWPGEGCGFVVLMRREDALAQGRRVYALVRGWGISSDGSGGITRPEAEGQLEALARAYRRAGFGPDTVTYCEGHGTGTALGDATELAALAQARRAANPTAPAAALGSIKANIGHTKAAAGVAGLIKAAQAVHTQVVPPTTGCETPHPELSKSAGALRILRQPELWPADRPLRASVSAMGFGGINTHVVLEGIAAERRTAWSRHERVLARSNQDAELFLCAAATPEALRQEADRLRRLAQQSSRSELIDLAAHQAATLRPGTLRAALVAAHPAELAAGAATLADWLEANVTQRLDFEVGVFLSSNPSRPRLAFLFPGQGSPTYLDGGLYARRFDAVRELYARAELTGEPGTPSTRVAQPAIVTASLAGLAVLAEFGLTADVAVGHSLGEITALHWAGALNAEALLRIARVRGAAMADLGSPTGVMVAIEADWPQVDRLLNGEPVAIVGFNSTRQTVVAGETGAVQALAARARRHGLHTVNLPVSHAFHTPLVAAAAPVLAAQLARESFRPLAGQVISTVTGEPLPAEADVRGLLVRQVTAPVRFVPALKRMLEGAPSATPSSGAGSSDVAGGLDLAIEVGPGRVLSGLVQDGATVPVVALDAGGPSLRGLWAAVGAGFALGAPVRTQALFEGRFARPIDPDRPRKFLANPCESVPALAPAERSVAADRSDSSRADLAPAPSEIRDRSPGPTRSHAQADTGQAPHAAVEPVPVSPLELVRQLVAERAELPVTAVTAQSRVLGDLHLNSITVGQVVSEAARRLGLPRVVGLTEFANASVAEIAQALDDLQRTGAPHPAVAPEAAPAGVDTWIRNFEVAWVEGAPVVSTATRTDRDAAPSTGLTPPQRSTEGWRLWAPSDHPLADALAKALPELPGRGQVVCLPPHPNDTHAALLLEAGQAALARMNSGPGPERFVVVHSGWGGGGFARSLHLEAPALATCVLDVPFTHPRAAAWVAAEARTADRYHEVRYDAQGRRWEPRLRLLAGPARSPQPHGLDPARLSSTDVLLVTGGGKGIAAECALALAKETGVRLALLGRSATETDPELAANLARLRAAGAQCWYGRADVTNALEVQQAIAAAQAQLGPITAVLHGAGANVPQLVSGLNAAAFRATLAPKVDGLRHVLAALANDRLRLLVTFGSIIARTGFRGEADYATANEWLAGLTAEFQGAHPQCRCYCLEWSVWSGVGMGQRLGRLESLVQQGITPISVEDGVRAFCDLVGQPWPATAVVVTGRFGTPPTLPIESAEIPLLRFLERTRVHYPGVELVVDAQLTADTDPYLRDHALQKELILPGVMGFEAMAQAVRALTGTVALPRFDAVEFLRPVTLSNRAACTIRVAALAHPDGVIDLCLRSDQTDFQVDHFRAQCRCAPPAHDPAASAPPPDPEAPLLPLVPAQDLYGGILFHRGRFCRLRGYRHLRAKECVAELTADDAGTWFGSYLPGEFVLGDPAARDAALHAVQACIPHARLLPAGVDRLSLYRLTSGPRRVCARQQARRGDEFVYDLAIGDASGEILEEWAGLRLRAVQRFPKPATWPVPLLGPYLERRLEELWPASSVAVALEPRPPANEPGSRQTAMARVVGPAVPVWRRPDGRPEVTRGQAVSAAYTGALALVVSGPGTLACDLEPANSRPTESWLGLLGTAWLRLAERIAAEAKEGFNCAATRLWCAGECLKKIGAAVPGPLLLERVHADGWVLLRSGQVDLATYVGALADRREPVVVGFATGRAPIVPNSARHPVQAADADVAELVAPSA